MKSNYEENLPGFAVGANPNAFKALALIRLSESTFYSEVAATIGDAATITNLWSLCYKFDSLNQENGKRSSIDSFLTERWIIPPQVFFDLKNDSLVSQIKDIKKGLQIEKYISKNKIDPTYNDSTFFYYTSEINGIHFSFSRKLDSIKKMKLYKFKLIYNKNSAGSNLFERSAKKLFFELNEVPINNPNEITSFFKRFDKIEK